LPLRGFRRLLGDQRPLLVGNPWGSYRAGGRRQGAHRDRVRRCSSVVGKRLQPPVQVGEPLLESQQSLS
jgi:hypothetical protein